MLTIRPLLFFVAALASPMIATADYTPNDFDQVCHYFTDMSKLANVKRMTPKQRNKYISKRIKKELNPKGGAATAWRSVSRAEAQQRYDLFMTSAQSLLRQPWSCNAMEIWAAKTGYSK